MQQKKKTPKRTLYRNGGPKVKHPIPPFLPRYRVAHNKSTSPGTILEATSLKEAEEKIAEHICKFPDPTTEYFIYEMMPVVFVSKMPVLTKLNLTL